MLVLFLPTGRVGRVVCAQTVLTVVSRIAHLTRRRHAGVESGAAAAVSWRTPPCAACASGAAAATSSAHQQALAADACTCLHMAWAGLAHTRATRTYLLGRNRTALLLLLLRSGRRSVRALRLLGALREQLHARVVEGACSGRPVLCGRQACM